MEIWSKLKKLIVLLSILGLAVNIYGMNKVVQQFREDRVRDLELFNELLKHGSALQQSGRSLRVSGGCVECSVNEGRRMTLLPPLVSKYYRLSLKYIGTQASKIVHTN